VTESYINNFCSLTGDLNPLHVDIEVAKKTIYGERIAPGTLTASLTFTAFAMLAYGTGMALLELNFNFMAPVKINDTLEVEIEVLAKTPSRKYADQGGIVHQRMTTRNQHGAVVADATGKILISKVPSYELLDA
jgi:3-hydroxybutyryl-CoA dehydratase